MSAAHAELSSVESPDRWMPPGRRRHAQWVAVAGTFIFVVLLVGYIIIQWKDAFLQTATACALLVIGAVVALSVVEDLLRRRDRQVLVGPGWMRIACPGTITRVNLARVSLIRYSPTTEAFRGIEFLDDQGQLLARVDTSFVEDPIEAAQFIKWLQDRADLPEHIRRAPAKAL